MKEVSYIVSLKKQPWVRLQVVPTCMGTQGLQKKFFWSLAAPFFVFNIISGFMQRK
jgi:hypothetical protein